MDSPIRPQRPLEPTETRDIIVQPIEKDKKIEEHRTPLSQELSKNEPAMLYSVFTNLLSKLTDLFHISEEASERPSEDEITTLLRDLKNHLSLLQKKDLSEHVDFAQKFSDIWTQLIIKLEQAKFHPGSYSFRTENIQEIIDGIHNYPYSGDHRLGYYLKEHAGKDWLPFPFMELLKKLYTDTVYDPLHSDLARWVFHLKKLLGEHPSISP